MFAIPTLAYPMLVLFWSAVFFTAYQLVPSGEKEEVERRLGVQGVSSEASDFIKAMQPIYALLSPAFAWIPAPRYRNWIDRNFVSAGMSGVMSSDEFFGYKAAMSVAFWTLFVGIAMKTIIRWDEPLSVDVLVLLVGAFFPDIWLTSAVKDRQQRIRRALPYVMDLLTLSVEAGLDFVAGLSKVCEKAKKGPLIDELSYFLSEMQLGASRQQALRNLSYRVNMPEVRSFSALLIQADILGASVGPVLRAQSDLIRTQRFQRAERMGAYASQKILFPLIMCIMPAVFIVIFGPILLNFLYGDGTIGL